MGLEGFTTFLATANLPQPYWPSGDLAAASHLQWRDRVGFAPNFPVTPYWAPASLEAPDEATSPPPDFDLRLAVGSTRVKPDSLKRSAGCKPGGPRGKSQTAAVPQGQLNRPQEHTQSRRRKPALIALNRSPQARRAKESSPGKGVQKVAQAKPEGRGPG